LKKEKDGRWRMKGRNLANGNEFDLAFSFELQDGAARLIYDDESLRSFTRFAIAPRLPQDGPKTKCRLMLRDDYSGIERKEREARIDEVDNSINQWGADLHHYMRAWRRWSWLPGWKAWRLHFWQNMKPMGRRIAFALIAISIGEFVLFLLLIAILAIERAAS
jgi:hypothetical protein